MTTTADEAAFLAAICSNPEDDTARLVYADWLDEHGNADRAEFIRVQCELAMPRWEITHDIEVKQRRARVVRRAVYGS